MPNPLPAILTGGKRNSSIMPAPMQAKLALQAAMVQYYRIGIRRRMLAPVACGY
jgi:hypothetical protein